MKKIAIAALLSSVVSGAALAENATMIFDGAAPVITPDSTLVITGIGNEAILPGTLTVAADGTFATKDAVAFEIRTRTAAAPDGSTPAVIGDVVTTPVNLKYTATEVSENGSIIAGATPEIKLGSSATPLALNTNATVQPTDTLIIASTAPIAGFEAKGGQVQATVSVMVSMP